MNGGYGGPGAAAGEIRRRQCQRRGLLASNFHLDGGAHGKRRASSLCTRRADHLGRRSCRPTPISTTDRRRKQPARGRRPAVGENRPFQPRGRVHISSNIWHGPGSARGCQPGFIGSGHVGDVRLRGWTSFDVRPARASRAPSSRLIGRRPTTAIGKATLAYDGRSHRARVRVTHIRRFKRMASRSPARPRPTARSRSGSTSISRSIRATASPCRASRWPRPGCVHALVYRDLNDNGVHDPGEPLEKGALVTTGTRRPSARPMRTASSPSAGSPLTRRSPSASTRPASPIRCSSRRRRFRSSCRGRAFRPRSRSAWSAAAISKARSSRAAGSASKASTSSWSTRPARSSAPRAPISTASSCSSGCLRQLHAAVSPRPSAAAAKIGPISITVEVTADKRSSGWIDPGAPGQHRVRRSAVDALSASCARALQPSDGPDVAALMVRSRRLELPRPFGHSDLNAARLPVPPRPHVMKWPAGRPPPLARRGL